MNSVFLDSGYLVALEIERDQNHAAAVQHWRKLLDTSLQLVTTSFILDEVVTHLNSRGLHRKAIEAGERLLASPTVRLIHVDEALLREALEHLSQRPDNAIRSPIASRSW